MILQQSLVYQLCLRWYSSKMALKSEKTSDSCQSKISWNLYRSICSMLVIWLWNPGPEYATTRHNAWQIVIDTFTHWRNKNISLWAMISHTDHIYVKPLTYMNLSWQSVQKLVNYYKISLDQLIIIHDELDIPAGDVRYKIGWWHGGHNGLRSIMQYLWSWDFRRIRVGIGRPQDTDVTSRVLWPRESSTKNMILEQVDAIKRYIDVQNFRQSTV